MAQIETLKKRRDFLAAARRRAVRQPGMLVQARARDDDNPSIRIGYTCSRKVGNAVIRNRAKRRLRAVAAQLLPIAGRSGWDYVLIGRAGSTVSRAFPQLVEDLQAALARLHSAG
ncbi:MAG: ribonuclease P protein component [Pseudomonadota bacterium]